MKKVVKIVAALLVLCFVLGYLFREPLLNFAYDQITLRGAVQSYHGVPHPRYASPLVRIAAILHAIWQFHREQYWPIVLKK